MAQLTYPLTGGELLVPVVVGLSRPTIIRLLNSGQPIPQSFIGKGVIDTAATVTALAMAVVQHLGLVRVAQSSTQTASGRPAVDLYRASLSLLPHGHHPGPMLTAPDLLVMELPTIIQDVDVLVGLDVLLTCRLTLDGPVRQFTLEF